MMRKSLVRLSRRFQSSTATTTTAAANASSSLDLDFVLNLLDYSSKGGSNTGSRNGKSSTSSISSTTWVPRMKFKVIEQAAAAASNEESLKEAGKDGISCIEKRNDFSNLFGSFLGESPFEFDSHSGSEAATTISTLNRLQTLADSLPTQIYDRNGNLIPLNTSQPPMNFFDISTSSASASTSNTNHHHATSPIFQRENVDWSNISLTSILKKIVPEEVFKTEPALEEKVGDMAGCSLNAASASASDPSASAQSAKAQSAKVHSAKCAQNTIIPEFTYTELKLLDRDQLKTLAKYLNIPSDQTDYRIEHAIISTDKPKSKPKSKSKERNNSTKNAVSKDKISWTEENETLLMKLYEELRLEKNKVDQKLHSIVSQTTTVPNAPSLKRGNGASERGLWAVLGDRMRQASKFHVSVTDCRNKLIILKRLKA